MKDLSSMLRLGSPKFNLDRGMEQTGKPGLAGLLVCFEMQVSRIFSLSLV